MLKRKHMIIGALAFCLVATLFIGITTSETGSSTTSILPYDPWVDINSDGMVDIVDVVNVALSFGTTGNPTKNVTVTNWPAAMNVNVTNWQGLSTVSETVRWVKYTGQHVQCLGFVLVPPDLGQVGALLVDYYYPSSGTYSISQTFHNLGKINLKIPKNKEILAKITLTCDNIKLKNLTMEFGHTNKTAYTSLVSASWAGDFLIPSPYYGFTLELGSLDSDYTISDQYIYFKVYMQIQVTANDRHFYFNTRSDYTLTSGGLSYGPDTDMCVLIPSYG